jgi:hypothetical protein
MITQTSPTLATARASGVIAPPKNLLNCYEILNASALSRPVNIYRVEFSDPAEQTHETVAAQSKSFGTYGENTEFNAAATVSLST